MADFDGSVFAITATKRDGEKVRELRDTVEKAYSISEDWTGYDDVMEVTIHEFTLIDLIDDAIDEALNVYSDNYFYRWGRIEV